MTKVPKKLIEETKQLLRVQIFLECEVGLCGVEKEGLRAVLKGLSEEEK